MSVIVEAIKELLEFGFGWLWAKPTLPETNSVLKSVLLSEAKPILLPATATPESYSGGSALVATKAYVAVPKARVWQRPVLTFDGEVTHLSYATPVELLGYEGRFAHVRYHGQVGWVLKDELATSSAEIFPEFNTGEIYSANHPETKKLRTLLADEFAAAELYLPLQDVELVTYELSQKGKSLPWDLVRPRIAGTWQNILKGKPTIQIGISPKTGSVLEFIHSDGTGFVGYIEAVSVDESITVAGLGRLIAGEYRREVLPKVVWQEWRPIFIQII